MEILNLTPQQYHNLEFDIQKLPDLANAGYISASILSRVRDPIKMVYGPRPASKAIEWGSLVDCLWTTPDAFSSQYVVVPDDAPTDHRSNERIANAKKPSQATIDGIKWWNDFESLHAGKEFVSATLLREAQQAVHMLMQHPIASDILACSTGQVAIVGDSPYVDGAKAKCLIDLLPGSGKYENAVVDLKTTHDISEYGMTTTAIKFDYPTKLEYYSHLAELATNIPRDRKIIIWQSSVYPYEVKVREFDERASSAARVALIARHAKLQTINPADMRPQFDNTLRVMALPDWGLNAIVG